MVKYRKVWFASKLGATAGIIIEDAKLAEMLKRPTGVQDVSRLFPYSECLKMRKMHVSPLFDTWEDAFAFETHKEREP